MRSSCGVIVAAFLLMGVAASAHAADPAYFTRYDDLRMTRDKGVLVVEMNNHGSALKFTAHDHETFVDAFYDIGRDRDNKAVILTGAGGDWMGDIDFGSFGNVADPDVWAKVHDEGEQVLQNLANIRVPVICAVEGKAWVHSEYCLLANVIVAGEGATFNDLPHFKGGIVPGDGVYTLWAYYVGPGRAPIHAA
jgi:enoyl-CoA hydratase/carnithine racemase